MAEQGGGYEKDLTGGGGETTDRLRSKEDDEELNGSGGDVLTVEQRRAKAGDEKDLIKFRQRVVVPKLGRWSDGGVMADSSFSGIFNKVRDDRISGMNDNVENLDFGRDTNRLDLFRVTAFDVNGDDNLSGIASYGGGGGGGGDRTGQIVNFANNNGGGEVVLERSEQERGGGGGGGGSGRWISGEKRDLVVAGRWEKWWRCCWPCRIYSTK